MEVKIVSFPETKVAVVEHCGSPESEHASARKLIEWKIAHQLFGDKFKSYGVHYTNPLTTPPDLHRVDFCLSIEGELPPHSQDIVCKTIPSGRCAVARNVGSRDNVAAASYLCEQWLPKSGKSLRDFPIFFHYVNVGPGIQPEEMITDVYLPIR